jgi:glycosyltransferase involved in cell wall biosynthesis
MNRKRKTLIVLTPGFPRHESDDTCLPLQQALILAIQEQDPELEIVILSFQYPYFAGSYQWNDITVHAFDGRNRGGIRRLVLRGRINAELGRISRSTLIVGILSFWYGECALVGSRFARRHHLHHYCWILGQDAKADNRYPARVSIPASDLVALSDFIADEFERNHFVRPARVVPPGVAVTGSSNGQRDIDVLAVGTLIPLKQYHLFLHVVSQLKSHIPGIRAVLIGEGPESSKLKDLAARLGIELSVTMTGELPHEEVLRYMRRAKVLLHPSSYEGFGVVCLEALACGCRVVSFVKPMHEIISNWEIATDGNDMLNRSLRILQRETSSGLPPVIPYPIDATAQRILDLVSGRSPSPSSLSGQSSTVFAAMRR